MTRSRSARGPIVLGTAALAGCLLAPGCTGKHSETAQEADTNAEAGVVSAPGDYLKGLGKGRRSAVRTVDTAALNAAIQLFSVEHAALPQGPGGVGGQELRAPIARTGQGHAPGLRPPVRPNQFCRGITPARHTSHGANHHFGFRVPIHPVHRPPRQASTVKATLQDGGTAPLTMLFRFREDGLIESVRAEARGRAVAGTVVPTPWEGRWGGYELRDGMRVPIDGEVAWILPEWRKPYWRGRITQLRYEFAR